MNRIAPILLLTLVLLFATTVASANVPRLMSYQGVVLDGSGNPVPGPVTLKFNIYVEDGGPLIWSETHSNVFLTGGVFDVKLGSINILNIPFDDAYEIEVESPPGVELSPRKSLTAAPYALNTRRIDNGVAVRSLNGLTENLDLVAGTNVTITAQGDSALVINSSGGGIGGGDSDWLVVGNNMNSIPTGNVGIGIAPTAKLHIYAQDTFGTTLRLQDGGSGAFHYANFMMMTPSSQGRVELLTNAMNISTYTDGVALQLSSHEPLDLRVDGSDRVRVELNGRTSFLADDGLASVEIDPDHLAGNGEITIRNANGDDVVVAGSTSDGNGSLTLRNDGGGFPLAFSTSNGGLGDLGGGRIDVQNEIGQDRIVLEASEAGSTSDGAQLTMYNDFGVATVGLDADLGGTDGGQLALFNAAGVNTVEIRGQESTDPTNGASLYLRNDTGTTTIELDADYGASGQGRIITEVLEITGGADLSEQFDIAGVDLEPGTVVVIDPSRPGGLARSAGAYDKRVAGVISGANGVNPGMVMGQRGSVADGQHPVALTGRVYVKVDATHGAIEPGDLLTTSPTPGHAMKATDSGRAHGTILGKAMTGLENGTGLVLVLVTLQ
jgi:hypothetical protein